jgi:Mg/Co/Ni transporter MgtE
MLDRVVLLGICLLICSITPASALEMGGIESYSVPVTTTTSSGGVNVFGINPVSMGIEAVSAKNKPNNESNNNSNNNSNVNRTANIIIGVVIALIVFAVVVCCLYKFIPRTVTQEVIDGHIAELNRILPLSGFPCMSETSNSVASYMAELKPAVGARILESIAPDKAKQIIPCLFRGNLIEIAQNIQPDKLAVVFRECSCTVATICDGLEPAAAAKTLSYMPDKAEYVLSHMVNKKPVSEILSKLQQEANLIPVAPLQQEANLIPVAPLQQEAKIVPVAPFEEAKIVPVAPFEEAKIVPVVSNFQTFSATKVLKEVNKVGDLISNKGFAAAADYLIKLEPELGAKVLDFSDSLNIKSMILNSANSESMLNMLVKMKSRNLAEVFCKFQPEEVALRFMNMKKVALAKVLQYTPTEFREQVLMFMIDDADPIREILLTLSPVKQEEIILILKTPVKEIAAKMDPFKAAQAIRKLNIDQIAVKFVQMKPKDVAEIAQYMPTEFREKVLSFMGEGAGPVREILKTLPPVLEIS